MAPNRDGLRIEVLPALQDNYIYLLRWPALGTAAVIDPGAAEPVLARLAETDETLTHILITHHHHDHIGGVAALHQHFACTIVGAAADTHRIEGIDQPVADGDVFALHGTAVKVLATPGHTVGHVVYYLPSLPALFSADTLFALGCGRLFEGSAAEMFAALQTLRALPDDTLVYCGHEYTQANLRFALSLAPADPALARRAETINQQRSQNQPTSPFRLDEDRATNPFLRAETVEAFAALRAAKDTFR